MAAQFQSHVFENGQWVTRTTNINDLINKPTMKPTTHKREIPVCGIMTRTVVQSPVAHWILRVRLRSPQHNDIAFVGDHYVQISELGQDGQLHSIIKKSDFGSRIRNAKVVGTSPKVVKDENDSTAFHAQPESEDIDKDMTDFSTPASPTGAAHLPPQLLLIVLETGDCIFLCLRPGKAGVLGFSALQHEIQSKRLVPPGFHLAVDPSSRYVAQACARDLFVVHELESIANLNACFVGGQPSLNPVRLSRPRKVNGVIHTMEFLYPRHHDPHHVILLLIVVRNGVSRMITYDWELGDDLREVLAEEKNGHKLPSEHKMPLLIIPLTIRSAFFAVSEDEVAFCKDVLHGPPSFEPCEIGDFPVSQHHNGADRPLWTAWSRPPRLSIYHRNKDFIYVAREDGVVMYLECDSDNILGAAVYHGTFCNVLSAFTSMVHENDDILVFGGDSGMGGVWKAPPREKVTRLSQIPNWSPTVDFATTTESSRWDNHSGATGKPEREEGQESGPIASAFRNQDIIFAAAGRGRNGSIVEYRHGLQANIGLELDVGTVSKRCFWLPANVSDPGHGYQMLLSFPDRTALLYIPPDFSESLNVNQDQTPYDLLYSTLLASSISEEVVVQVTEGSIVFVNSSTSSKISFATLGLGEFVLVDATLAGDLLAVTSLSKTRDNYFELHVFKLDAQNLEAIHLYKAPLKGEVTSLGVCSIGGKIHAVASLWSEETAYLDFYNIQDQEHVRMVPVQYFAENFTSEDPQRQVAKKIEPFTSIVSVYEGPQKSVLVAGSRDGILMTLSIGYGCREDFVSFEIMGSVPVAVYAARDGSALVSCDSSLVLISGFRGGSRGFTEKQSVWTVDANDSSKRSPNIISAVVLRESLSENKANMPLLLSTTDKVLLAELQPQAGPVQRHIPLGMTPHKVLYSHVLKCLVVAARTLDSKPTLRFIDPDTGDDLSLPVQGQTKEPVEFISGLGQSQDRILCLEEWHIGSKNGNFYYLLVGTHGAADGGRVLIVSPKKEKPRQGETQGRICFWTRHKIKGDKKPVYAVAGTNRKIQAVIGETLYYHRLAEGEKKLTMVATHELRSPAHRLTILPEKPQTLALTRLDSLMVLGEDESDGGFSVTNVDPVTRQATDMLEVAFPWSPRSPAQVLSQCEGPPFSIVLLADPKCGLTGLWIPRDCPDKTCEVLFECELPSSVRRLRLGRTLPAWSRDMRRQRRFGLLPASVDDAEILGMGIDGSLQHFTLLDSDVWRFFRFVQNVSEKSPELYPFTHIQLDSQEDGGEFDPTPTVDESLEMQVDGDLMQRILDKRALEGLISGNEEWLRKFMEYLDGVDGGQWTARLRDIVNLRGREREYFALAYEILEYFLVPVI